MLAITSAERSVMVPDLPPLSEFPGLAGFDTSWQGMWAPKGTPKEIVHLINDVITKAAATDAVKSQLANSGPQTVMATPDKFGAFVSEEVEKWAKLVKFSGAKVD